MFKNRVQILQAHKYKGILVKNHHKGKKSEKNLWHNLNILQITPSDYQDK